MSRPIAFFGAREGGQLLQALAGGSDAGVAITPRLQPRAIAFAGAGGELSFERIYLPLTWTMAGTIRVTPIVDGRELDPVTFAIPALDEPRSEVFEIIVSEPFTDPVTGEEFGRIHPRGTWITCRVELTSGVGSDASGRIGRLIVNDPELEFEVVRESRDAAG